MPKLKDLTYTGEFAEATCGLVHPFRDGYAVGCGKAHKLEQFEYTLEDGKTRSTVALCPACAAKQMTHRKERQADGSYILYVGDTCYATAERALGGWNCHVWVSAERHTVWGFTLREAEVDALAWYRFFTKGAK